jgi:uncharacterized membrane-anchored protein YhcB (DUF1043 family)
MADTDWLIAGLIIGLLVGVPLGWIFAQYKRAETQPQSAVFDRDEEGRIVGIHYVAVGSK